MSNTRSRSPFAPWFAALAGAASLLVAMLVVSAAPARASVAVGTDLAGVDTLALIAQAGADATDVGDAYATHVAGEVALDLPLTFAEVLGGDVAGDMGYVFYGPAGFVLVRDMHEVVAPPERDAYVETMRDNLVGSGALYGATQTNDVRWQSEGAWEAVDFWFEGYDAGYTLYGDANFLFLDDSTWYVLIVFPVDEGGTFHEGCGGAIRNSIRPATADDAASTETLYPLGVRSGIVTEAIEVAVQDGPTPAVAPVFETTVDGHAYAVYCESMTWHDAKAFCENLGGHLVTITDFYEQQIVAGLTEMGAEKGDKANYWIGLTTETGSPAWVTGEPYDYNNWREGQPDGYIESDGRAERYAHIFADDRTGTDVFNHTWNDACDAGSNDMWYFALDRFGFICEFDEPAQAQPAAADAGGLPAGPAAPAGDASIVDANATNLLVGIAYDRAKAICDYTVAENIVAMSEEEGGSAFGRVINEELGLAEFSQVYAFAHWGDMMAAVFTVPDGSPAFLNAFADSWQLADGSNISGDVKSLFDAVQARAGLPALYERPVGWTDDVVVVLATYESGYALVTNFHGFDETSVEAYTVVCRLADGGDWAGLVTDLIGNGAIAGSPFPAFAGQTYGDQYVAPLPDNGVPSAVDSAPGGLPATASPAGTSISGYPDAVLSTDDRLNILGKWPFSDRLIQLFDSLAGWDVDGALPVFPGALTAADLVSHHVMQDNAELHDELAVHGPLLRAMTWSVVEVVPCDPYRLQERVGGDLYWFDDGYLIYVDCTEASEGETVHTLIAVYALQWGGTWWLVFEG